MLYNESRVAISFEKETFYILGRIIHLQVAPSVTRKKYQHYLLKNEGSFFVQEDKQSLPVKKASKIRFHKNYMCL
jgi:hypothetical protein